MGNSDKEYVILRKIEWEAFHISRNTIIALCLSLSVLGAHATEYDKGPWERNGYLIEVLEPEVRKPQALSPDDKKILRSELQQLLCDDGSYFRECLIPAKNECTKKVQQELRECLTDRKVRHSAKIMTRSELAFSIGWCIGHRLKRNKKHEPIPAKCQTLSQWK